MRAARGGVRPFVGAPRHGLPRRDSGGFAPPAVQQVLRSPGRPLDRDVRASMERGFGRDFSRVRIHTDASAAGSAAAVNARAYTVGRSIAFGAGQYAPTTPGGRRLLAHELAHVVQQDGPAPAPVAPRLASPDGAHEQEATRAATRAIERGDRPVGDVRGGAPISLRRTQPSLMRARLFASTLEICRQYLRSRTFRVREGGLRVVVNAHWESSSTNPAVTRFCRPEQGFSIALRAEKALWFDEPWGSCEFPGGRAWARSWTGLPAGDYYLEISTPDSGPYCCLRGSIEVFDERGLSGETCTRRPPGPLEILHTALEMAGLIPALGAVPDAINTGIYVIEGDWTNAGLSAVAMVPIFGDAATVGRRASKTVLRVTEEGVQRVGVDGIVGGIREARSAGRVADREVAQAVERGIVEEAATAPTAVRARPRAAPRTGRAAAARRGFRSLRDDYARRLGVRRGGQVHHAVELQVLDRYPGVFTERELNAFGNMRGIATEKAGRRQLHNSKVREIWDRHYVGLDREIASRGLRPGTPEYRSFARRYLESARDEIDYVLGQFFAEYRVGMGLP